MPKQESGPMETFQQVLRGIADKSSLDDSILDVVFHDPAEENAAGLLRRIRAANWRGTILVYPVRPKLAHDLAHQAACVSVVENYQHDLIDSIDVDQSEAIFGMVERLRGLGHRRIGFLTWTYTVPTPWVMHRFGSYVEALYRCGIEFNPDITINVRPGEAADPSEVARRALKLARSGVTAFVCAADHQAYRLMTDLEAAGVRIPQEVSITGFDGIPPPQGARQIATVKVPYEELGRSAVHQLLRRLEQPTAPRRHILVDGDILEGKTLAKARG